MDTSPLSISDRVAQVLQVSPDLSLEELRARLSLEGIKVHHAQYNRARTQLGLRAKVARKKRTILPAEPVVVPLEPPRQKAVAQAHGTLPDYEGLVTAVRSIQEERAKLRALLQQILEIVEEAL